MMNEEKVTAVDVKKAEEAPAVLTSLVGTSYNREGGQSGGNGSSGEAGGQSVALRQA